MTKRFPLTPDLTCHELDGYKLPPLPDKAEFTIDDIRKAFLAGIEITWEGRNGEDWETPNTLEKQFGEDADKYIASIRPARRPIAIEVEMERVVDYSATGRYNDFVVRRTDYKIVPATHPDGTVKGIWVY